MKKTLLTLLLVLTFLCTFASPVDAQFAGGYRGRYSGPIEAQDIKYENALVVQPGKYKVGNGTLQGAYDWLASSARDGQMGVLAAINKRTLILTSGTYTDSLNSDTDWVDVVELTPGTITLSGDITISANHAEIPEHAIYLGDVHRTAWTAANHYEDIHAGGWGYKAINGDAIVGSTATSCDLDNPINVAGTITRVKLRLCRAAGWEGGKTCKVKFLRGTAPTFTLVGYADITTEVDAAATTLGGAGRFEVDVDISASAITVQVGDYLAITLPTTSSTGISASFMNAGGIDSIYGTGDTETLDTTRTGYSAINASVYIDDSTLYLPTEGMDISSKGTGDTISLPWYENAPYYIIINDVLVADTGTLALSLDYTDAAGDNAVAEVITINFSGDGDDGKILLTTGSASKDLVDKDAAQLTGEKITLFIWFDPVGQLMEVLWTSYYQTTGPEGVLYDLRIASITDRSPYSVAAGRIDRITITDAGSDATFDDLDVCRNPVVCGIDSFVAKHSTDHIAPTRLSPLIKVAGIFPQPRKAIVIGTSGQKLLIANTSTRSAFTTQWDTAGSDQDMIAFRDVTFLLFMSVANDIGALDDYCSEAKDLIRDYLTACETIIQDVISSADVDGGANELIMVGPLGDPSAGAAIANLPRKKIYNDIDKGLKLLCATNGVPYVSALKTFQNSSDALFGSASDINPGTDGRDYLIKQVVNKWIEINETY